MGCPATVKPQRARRETQRVLKKGDYISMMGDLAVASFHREMPRIGDIDRKTKGKSSENVGFLWDFIVF